jgi:thiamine biosynthesis lipoprotein
VRTVFETMGTVATLDGATEHLTATVKDLFENYEARFSLYRPDSELSRVASGELSLLDSSDELRDAYADAQVWGSLTGGVFTPHRPDGVIDLNGIVKARAMQAAGAALSAAGCHDWSLNVGGDILVSGVGAAPIGIVDPADRATLLAAIDLSGTRRAVATSGSAERGDHIWLAGTTERAEFVQATVVADDIVTADILATAIIAGGRATLDEITARWDVDVLTVDRVGELLASPGLRASLVG